MGASDDLGSLLVSQGVQAAATAPGAGISEGVATGVKLAQLQEETLKNRASLELAKRQAMFESIKFGAEGMAKAVKEPDQQVKNLMIDNHVDDMKKLGVFTDPITIARAKDDEGYAKSVLAFQNSVTSLGGTIPQIAQMSPVLNDMFGKDSQKTLDNVVKMVDSAQKTQGLPTQKFDFEKQKFLDTTIAAKSKQVESAYKNSDTLAGPLNNANQILDEAIRAQASGNPVNATAVNEAKLLVARLAVPNRLNVQEIDAIAKQQGIEGHFNNFMTEKITGETSPQKIQQLKQVVGIAAQVIDRDRQNIANQLRPSFKSAAFPDAAAAIEQGSGLSEKLRPILYQDPSKVLSQPAKEPVPSGPTTTQNIRDTAAKGGRATIKGLTYYLGRNPTAEEIQAAGISPQGK